MRSLLYLLLTSLKNTLKELRRSPGKLILTLGVVGLIVGLAILGTVQQRESTLALPLMYLQAAFFAFLMIFVLTAVAKGLGSGDTFFEMNDVNLLFVSPVSPRKILVYGILRTLKTAFFAGFFLLYQYNNIAQAFRIGFSAILILLGGFMLAMTLCQIVSLLIYSLTSSHPERKKWVKLIAAVVYLPLLIPPALAYIKTGSLLAALDALCGSPLLCWLPIAGWGSAAAIQLISGNIGMALLMLAVLVGVGWLLVQLILSSHVDYYEDVLVATETAFERKLAQRQGRQTGEMNDGRPVKIKGQGLWGSGAGAIFGKHLRESLRENPLLLSWVSWIEIGACVLVALLARGSQMLLTLLQILMWVQIMLIGTGRGMRETAKPYLYLIPESPTKKLVWNNMEMVFRALVESLVIFPICGAILGESALVILGSTMCYALFTMLLISVNYLSMRWTRADLSSGLMLLWYYLAVVVILLPGLAAALAVGFAVAAPWGVPLALLILTGWELTAAIACFALSRGVLSRCDMPAMGER